METSTKLEPDIRFTDDGKEQTPEEMEAKCPGLAAAAYALVKRHIEKWGDDARNHPFGT